MRWDLVALFAVVAVVVFCVYAAVKGIREDGVRRAQCRELGGEFFTARDGSICLARDAVIFR